MKKLLKSLLLVFVIGIIGTFLSACARESELLPDKKIYNVNWTIEDITRMEDGKKVDNDMAIKFDKKNFVMTDRNNAMDFTGTYELKKADTSYEVIMKIDDLKEPVTGIYGMRTYKDKEPKPDLVFDHWDTRYSFIGEYKDK